jgi:tetratricopeptide (TPR) repeat protein
LIILLALMCIGLAVAAVKKHDANDPVTLTRAKRSEPVARRVLAPLPPPGVPLVGPPGLDPNGYPRQMVDKAALRSLLFHGKLDELTADMEQIEKAFEENSKLDIWPSHAALAFSSADPQLGPLLEPWVSRFPNSFAPYLARGMHHIAQAYARRGYSLADKTADQDFEAMANVAPLAVADLRHAVALNPRLVVALGNLVEVLRLDDAEAAQRALQQAVAACPTCLELRVQLIDSLEPRWGGSLERMAVFVQDAEQSIPGPASKALEGFVEAEKAYELEEDERLNDALVALNHAVTGSPEPSILFQRAQLLRKMHDSRGSLADLTQVLAARPEWVEALGMRSMVRADLGDWDGAARDLLEGIRVDPTESLVQWAYPVIVQNLLYQAKRLTDQGQHAQALSLTDLARQIAPTVPGVGWTQGYSVMGRDPRPPPSQAELDEARSAAQQNPDDFRAQQRLDYTLSGAKDYEHVVPVWKAYIARHPEDGRAYTELMGTYHLMGQEDAFKAMAQRGCELGSSLACVKAYPDDS